MLIAAAAVPLLLLALGRDADADGAAVEVFDGGRWARDDFDLAEDLLDDPPPPKRASRLDAASFL